MTATTEELLFALRSPQNQNLAVLICALDEALRDPSFSPTQREQIGRILAAGAVTPSLRAAAENQVVAPMAAPSSEDFTDVLAWIGEAKPAEKARPRLTLVGSAA